MVFGSVLGQFFMFFHDLFTAFLGVFLNTFFDGFLDRSLNFANPKIIEQSFALAHITLCCIRHVSQMIIFYIDVRSISGRCSHRRRNFSDVGFGIYLLPTFSWEMAPKMAPIGVTFQADDFGGPRGRQGPTSTAFGCDLEASEF